MSAELRDGLESLDPAWHEPNEEITRTFAAAKQFYAREGHLHVRKSHNEILGTESVSLGQGIQDVRARHKAGRLGATEIAAWDSVEMVWDVRKQTLERNLAAARQYRAREGHLRVPESHTEQVGDELVNLGVLIHNTRQQYKSGRLAHDRIAAWESLGMTWSVVGHSAEIVSDPAPPPPKQRGLGMGF